MEELELANEYWKHDITIFLKDGTELKGKYLHEASSELAISFRQGNDLHTVRMTEIKRTTLHEAFKE